MLIHILIEQEIKAFILQADIGVKNQCTLLLLLCRLVKDVDIVKQGELVQRGNISLANDHNTLAIFV